MDEVVLPVEREHPGGEPVSSEVIEDLREEARARDVYCPQIDESHGGMGERFRDVLPLFEQAGRSLLGALAMRVDAPDEGNMHTLDLVGTNAQKEAWLEPLVAGEINSAFSMTEPQDAIDTALQMCGGSGMSKDLPVADFYASVRSFRIVDGADEVHKRTLARGAFEDVDTEELSALPRFEG